MPTQEQIFRMDIINNFMKVLSDVDFRKEHGGFFLAILSLEGTENNYSRFEFQNGKLFYIDKYTESRVYPYPLSKQRGFSGGGTLWGLVNDLREWIITGKRSNGNHGYAGLYCPHWGSGWTLELKDLIIEEAKKIGYLDKGDFTFTQFCLNYIENGCSSTVKDYIEDLKKLSA